jgi:hypothetical protein
VHGAGYRQAQGQPPRKRPQQKGELPMTGVTLTIHDDGLTIDDNNSPYQSIYDKTQLSGGKFSLTADGEYGVILRVSWLA